MQVLKIMWITVALGLAGWLASCTKQRPDDPAPLPEPEASAPADLTLGTQVYAVKGEVVEIKPTGTIAVIEHEEIPGYMAAMTMPFEVKDPKELAGVKPGDKVSFRMLVTEEEGWIDQVTVIESAPVDPKLKPTARLVRDVEPLELGELLPNYPLTNQFGQAIQTDQFRGQALAITFIFTRCPFPNFCPRMINHFSAAYRQLKSPADAPQNWHLLSLSFDPDYDTPAVLKKYAEGYQYDPQRWSFATGALIEIDALTEQFGLVFSRQPGSFNIDHTLRTVVIDTRGRVQHVFIGNEWTADELAEEIRKAAAVPVPDDPKS
jgi:protein SCO1